MVNNLGFFEDEKVNGNCTDVGIYMEMMLDASYFFFLQPTKVVTTLSKHWKTMLANNSVLSIKAL